jgi:hypothetical protein
MAQELSVAAAARIFDTSRVFSPRPCGCDLKECPYVYDLFHMVGLEEKECTATPSEVERALKIAKLACHPDKHGNSEEATAGFKALMTADEILRQEHAVVGGSRRQNRIDVERRRAYDFHYQHNAGELDENDDGMPSCRHGRAT